MFGSGRRKRGLSNPPLNNSNANPNATTAAAQAFLKNQTSNASLAAAAAGAAIRSRPTTPISVADVQTKRTIRRATSNSSMGSSRGGSVLGDRPELQRRGSSGSMTERTFRESSPHVPSARDVPPVPEIPRNISNSHRRTASLEAPTRMMSPPPNVSNGRGSSLGPKNTAPLPKRGGQRVQSLSSVSELTSLQRSDSRGSVNFSLPTSLRSDPYIFHKQLTYSPSKRQQSRIKNPANQHLVYDPNTRSFLPYAEILAIEERQRIQHAASLPVKKKKRNGPSEASGVHLTDRTMGSKPRGTAVDALEAANHQASAELSAQPSTTHQQEHRRESEPAPVSKKKRPQKVSTAIESDSDYSQVPNSDNDADYRAHKQSRPISQLVKKPSMVREEQEEEEEKNITPIKSLKNEESRRTISPSILPRSLASRNFSRNSPSPLQEIEIQKADSPTPVSALRPTTPANGNEHTTNGNDTGSRWQSASPTLKTHFAATPDNLVVRHDPPGRSVSPRKSALKHFGNSSRDPSPMGSDTGSNEMHSASAKKKANRVSFDQTNVVVGEAAGLIGTNSPVTQSPQAAKRNWFSLAGGRSKKDASAPKDDDEVMQPRPELPSFGSVRGANPRKALVEDRPLVKPAIQPETNTPIPSTHNTPQITQTANTGGAADAQLGQSNDYLISALLSQDAAHKQEANISKSREPLPPQATSVEGSGYHSDSDSTIGDESEPANTVISAKSPIDANYHEPAPDTAPPVNSDIVALQTNGDAPKILLTQPTPTLEDTNRKGWFDMPGGFPSSSTSDSEDDDIPTLTETPKSLPQTVEHQVTEPTPSMAGIAEPLDAPLVGSPVVGSIVSDNLMHRPSAAENAEDTTDTESIYSDAAEDLSDMEGDGFMSLNAVVERPVASPLSNNTPGLAISTSPESPTIHLSKQRAFHNSGLPREIREPESEEGWEKAQSYWRGLSEDKKHRMEQEAREEMDDNSEATVEAKPVPKRNKKIVAVLPPVVPVIQKPSPQVRHGRTYQIQPGSKASQDGSYTPAIRSSMRAGTSSAGDPTSDTHVRKSMRGAGTMNNSLRGDQPIEPRGALQKKSRPMSMPISEIRPDQDAVRMHVRALSAASASAAAKNAKAGPSLRRKGSGDSDTSFKRSKPAEVTTFRRSMRGGDDRSMAGQPQSSNMSSKYSLRSMSPAESQQRRAFSVAAPPSSIQPTHMRRSMRNGHDDTMSLRSAKSERTKSPSRILGFSRSSSARPAKSKLVPQRSSRFVDSSDEDDENKPSFRSRFVDSSDEDEPMPLPKTSGFRGSMRPQPTRRPTSIVEDDSSDLPDSDDEKKRLGVKTGSSNASRTNGVATEPPIKRSGSGREAMSPAISTNISAARPQHSRRGSFMSILRRKKQDDTSKVRKSDAESPARRDTPLERSRSDLAAVKRQESYNSTASARPMSPKLQKRIPSGSWPLPATTGKEEVRPFTSDGMGAENGEEGRPDIGTRRFTDSGLNGWSVAGDSAITPQRKKKKFQALRKMFGLYD
ncbi:hypothetical protein BJ878DRAFT_518127 [Calycina marina]|uniref:Uncharacterized protein n=1 Tax=Calycina marina TaxID=1763456 RepID=A0A9P7YZ69_9HELO|nr:hypothetical protein BJ878DRAFT_518127 [Calycina marina]